MLDLEAEVAALKTEVKYLKWIIPAACGFVALLILIFWNIERDRVGERVRIALDQEGVKIAIDDTKKALKEVVAYSDEIRKIKERLPWVAIPILSVDHKQKVLGQYFNFDYSKIDTVVGNDNWNDKHFLIVNGRTSEIAPAVLWRSSNGGSVGSGHGRWVSGSAPNQWNVGDHFIIVYSPK